VAPATAATGHCPWPAAVYPVPACGFRSWPGPAQRAPDTPGGRHRGPGCHRVALSRYGRLSAPDGHKV